MRSEHRLIRALHRQSVDRTPIWMMRQAGRYLPEYRALRLENKDFLLLCKTPVLATQVTLQPVERFDLDAAIIFSDILLIPEALGMKLTFIEGEGPRFSEPIQQRLTIEKMPFIDVESELHYVMEAIDLTKKALQNRLPLIGFSGSPWTLAAYMIEGGSSRDFLKIKGWLYRDPQSLHFLLNHLTGVLIDYLFAQVKAGVDVLMIFDTWGGVLAYTDYLNFSLVYMKRIIEGLHSRQQTCNIPIIIFSKNTSQHLLAQAQTGCAAISLDWTVSLTAARAQVGAQVALQGNLDPAVLYATPLQIEKAVAKICDDFGSGPGHIFNLGHGIPPTVDPEHVRVMINALQRYGVAG